MIFSIVEKISEHEGTQKVLVRGSSLEITTEINNIIKEVLKHGLSEELMMAAVFDAIEEYHKSKRV